MISDEVADEKEKILWETVAFLVVLNSSMYILDICVFKGDSQSKSQKFIPKLFLIMATSLKIERETARWINL